VLLLELLISFLLLLMILFSVFVSAASSAAVSVDTSTVLKRRVAKLAKHNIEHIKKQYDITEGTDVSFGTPGTVISRGGEC